MKVLDIDGLNYYDGKIKDTYATKTYVNTQDALKAPLASPALTGTPTAPTPTAGDDSTKLATTAFVQAELTDYVTLNDLSTELADYFPLSGGTVTGTITLSGTNQAMKNAVTNDYVEINGGTGEETGAHLSLYGKDHTTKGGNFTLEANDGVNGSRLTGTPDGTLSWSGGIRFDTTLYGSANNNVKIVMIGNSQSNKDGITAIYGGEVQDDGANLYVYGKNHSNGGRFTLSTYDGTNRYSLVGYPNGNLQWKGSDVCTSASTGTLISKSSTSSLSLSANTAKTILSISLSAGVWVITGHCYYTSVTASKVYGLTINENANAYGYARDSSVAVQSVGTSAISIQTSRVLTLSSAATIYLCGYATAATTANDADLRAVKFR